MTKAAASADELQALYARAMRLMAARDFEAALKLFFRFAALRPRVPEAHYQIGRINIEMNRARLALRPLANAATLKPSEPAIWTAWAEAVALGGDALAEGEFLTALKAAPVNPALKVSLQDRFGALRQKSRPATGGLPAAQIRQLLSLIESRRFPEAERGAVNAVTAHPASALAFNILGSAQAAQGKVQAALSSFQRAIALDPAYAEAHDNLGRLLMDQSRIDEAIAQFRKAVTLAPYMVSALVDLGGCLSRGHQGQAAIPLLERAVVTAPEKSITHLALGNAHTRLRNYQKAEEALMRGLELSPVKSADTLAMLAQAQTRLGKDDEAMANYDLALAADPDSAPANAGKAAMLQTLGDFDEAEVLFRRAFEIDRNNGESYRQFIASHKTKPGDPLVARMIDRFEDPKLQDTDRMNLGFAIAKAMEDVKDYGQVFRYLDAANGLMRKLFPYDIAQRHREVALIKAAQDDFDWKAARIEGASDYAPIFVTGMPRSGTTLIEQIIASHSQVEGAGEVGEGTRQAQRLLIAGDKARRVADMLPADIAALGRGYEDYLRARFPDAPRITDKSIQTYMYVGLLKLALPNARFIVVRRDPRDNLLSMYKNKFPDGTHLYAYDQRDLADLYGTFVEMVDFWRERVPDWFYEVQYEDLVANPGEESRKLIAACGLDWEDACLNFHENKRKVETLSVFQVRQPISGGSVKGWKRHEKELAPMLSRLKELGLVTD